MADANEYYSDVYPYNVVPQVKSPKPTGTMPVLKCPPDYSLQAIIMNCNNMSVIKGYEWKASFDLRELFIPVKNYLMYEFTLKADSDYTHYVTINYANIEETLGAGINFVMLFPQYQNMDGLDDQDKWFINYQNTSTIADPSIDSNWGHLGRILVLCGSDQKKVKPVYLQNKMGVDVQIKVLLGN